MTCTDDVKAASHQLHDRAAQPPNLGCVLLLLPGRIFKCARARGRSAWEWGTDGESYLCHVRGAWEWILLAQHKTPVAMRQVALDSVLADQISQLTLKFV